MHFIDASPNDRKHDTTGKYYKNLKKQREEAIFPDIKKFKQNGKYGLLLH